MGASIGVERRERGEGPWAGYIDLVYKGNSTRCLLTNSHVVEPVRGMAQDTMKSYNERRRYTYSRQERSQERSFVQTMAVKDVNGTLCRAEEKLADVFGNSERDWCH